MVSGSLAGGSSWVFLEGLDRVTELRSGHRAFLWLLPAAGFGVGLVYHRFGATAARGNDLVLEQIHQPTTGVPRRMAPLVLAGTWATHLFGGSAGREGTALQMSASLSDLVARPARLGVDERRLVLSTAVAAGFGAVFGVPLAATVFALEVPSSARVRHEALVPCLTAALVGDLVVTGLGHDHPQRPQLRLDVDVVLLAKLAVAGVIFGLTAAVFAELLHGTKRLMARWLRWPPLRPMAGGIGVVGLAAVFGHDYLGLSLPLIDRGLTGEHLSFTVFALKIVFTVVTVGSGFPGGEVTPLFVIGTTLGAALATPLHLDGSLVAAVGFVAVFAAAANTPLACTIMGVELFGSGAGPAVAVGCVVAYLCSRRRGIYLSQHVAASKGPPSVTRRPNRSRRVRRR